MKKVIQSGWVQSEPDNKCPECGKACRVIKRRHKWLTHIDSVTYKCECGCMYEVLHESHSKEELCYGNSVSVSNY